MIFDSSWTTIQTNNNNAKVTINLLPFSPLYRLNNFHTFWYRGRVDLLEKKHRIFSVLKRTYEGVVCGSIICMKNPFFKLGDEKMEIRIFILFLIRNKNVPRCLKKSSLKAVQ